MMFTGKTQRESWVCSVPDGPFSRNIQYLNHADKAEYKYKDKVQTKFLESALGHSWEDSSHGVNPVFGILLHHTGNLIETESIMLAT